MNYRLACVIYLACVTSADAREGSVRSVAQVLRACSYKLSAAELMLAQSAAYRHVNLVMPGALMTASCALLCAGLGQHSQVLQGRPGYPDLLQHEGLRFTQTIDYTRQQTGET